MFYLQRMILPKYFLLIFIKKLGLSNRGNLYFIFLVKKLTGWGIFCCESPSYSNLKPLAYSRRRAQSLDPLTKNSSLLAKRAAYKYFPYYSYFYWLFVFWQAQPIKILSDTTHQNVWWDIYIYIYIYIYITNCRQYCFGLLGLISAVLMLGWR